MSILSSGLRVATAAVVVAFSFAGPNTAGIARADGPDGSAVASDSAHVGPAVRSRSARAPQRVASSPPVAAHRAAAAASRNQTPQRMPASSIGHSRGDALPASSVAVRSAASTSVDSTQGVGGSTATAVNSAASAATAIADKVAAAHIGTVGSSARKTLQDRASCPSCWAFDGGQLHAALPPMNVVAINQLFDNAANWLSGLPPSPVRDLVAGALVLVRRTFFNFDGGNVGSGVGSAGTITFTELDSLTSPLAVRVDKTVKYVGDIFPEELLIDYTLIQRAPAELNRAGACDIASIHTALHDWKLARDNNGEAYDAAVAKLAEDCLNELDQNAEEVFKVTPKGIDTIVELYRREVKFCTEVGSSRPEEGAEHIVAYNIEHLTRRHFVHGDLVGFGIHAISMLQDNRAAWATDLIRRCGLRYDVPDASREELRLALATLKYFKGEAGLFYSVVDTAEIDPEFIEAVMAELPEPASK